MTNQVLCAKCNAIMQPGTTVEGLQTPVGFECPDCGHTYAINEDMVCGFHVAVDEAMETNPQVGDQVQAYLLNCDTTQFDVALRQIREFGIEPPDDLSMRSLIVWANQRDNLQADYEAWQATRALAELVADKLMRVLAEAQAKGVDQVDFSIVRAGSDADDCDCPNCTERRAKLAEQGGPADPMKKGFAA